MRDHREVASTPAGFAATATVASLALAVSMLPMFLFGALSGTIGAELGFDEARTGMALTAFFLAAALTAVPIGRTTERIGAGPAMRIGVTVSGLAALAAGTVAATWWQLALLLGIAGGVLPFVDTGGARAFTTAVDARRRGLAFGVKEASVPFASMLAGLAVPVLATTIGWRAAFLATACLAPLAWLGLGVLGGPAPTRAHARRRSPAAAVTPTGEARAAARRVPAAVRLFAVGFGLAGGASATAMTFLVPSAVAAGMQPAVAGTVLAVASVGSILARLVAGWGADRVGAVVSRGLVAAMVVGAAGAAIMTAGVAGWPILLAGVLLLTGGSGWTGLGFTAVVRAAPDLPATAAAIALTGLAIGGTAGPLLFGVVVSRAGYPAGWALLVGAFAVGAGVVAVALQRSVGGTTRAPTGTRR